MIKSEIALCYHFNDNLTKMTIFGFMSTILSLLTLWFSFWTFKRKDNEEEMNNMVSEDDLDKFNETGQFDDQIESINFSPYIDDDKKPEF